MPLISTSGTVPYFLKKGKKLVKSFDQGWSEVGGAQKIYSCIKSLSSFNQSLQNNNLKIFLMLFVFWIIFLIFVILI